MVRLTDRPDMTLDVYRGRKTTTQQQQQQQCTRNTTLHSIFFIIFFIILFSPECNHKDIHGGVLKLCIMLKDIENCSVQEP